MDRKGLARQASPLKEAIEIKARRPNEWFAFSFFLLTSRLPDK